MQKKKSKYKAIDFIIFFSCLAGACLSGVLFWREYNSTLVKLNEEPVGIIIFKKHVAQRKFIDRDVWDRLKQTSPIYNGDTIRTIDQSEAIVILEDETTSLTLYDSTMIQIYYTKKGDVTIDFSGGNIEVVSENKNAVISSGTSTIVVEGKAIMNKNEEGFVLSVVEGQASFDGAEVETGSVLTLDSDGNPDVRPIVTMKPSSPSVFAETGSAGMVPIVFSWTAFHFDPDTQVIVETAFDRRFSRIAEARETSGVSSVTIPLEKGNYWWRVYPAAPGSREPANWYYPTGVLEVIPAAISDVQPPTNAAAFEDESPILPLPPVMFNRNVGDWDDLDAETIARNNSILSRIIVTLNTHGEYRLRVEGHANPVINPDDTYGRLSEQNEELKPLSEMRARAVVEKLVKLGADSRRLDYAGFGGEHPVAAWEDSENWWKNRRVEFTLMK